MELHRAVADPYGHDGLSQQTQVRHLLLSVLRDLACDRVKGKRVKNHLLFELAAILHKSSKIC